MSKSVLFEKGSSVKRQMASLTKIMTCLVTLQVMDQMDLDISKISVIVTKKAASMIGTTA
jgi:D-alanyl-D-alanine carboxypeptidase